MAKLTFPPIRVVAYDANWPRLFESEKKRIRQAFAPLRVVVEHVGSTAVPGLDAKPVIDIVIGMRMDKLLDIHIEALRAIGYAYVRARRSALCLYRGRPRAYVIHLVEMGGREWREKLAFRDYLRANPDAARKYAMLKQQLTQEPTSSGHYSAGKHRLIAEILVKASKMLS